MAPLRLARKSPFTDERSRFAAGRFGMRLFLASLAMLFGASVLGFIVVRVQLGLREEWPRELPALPLSLWPSTAVLVLSSVSIQGALGGVRRGAAAAVRRGMSLTLLLAVTFLALQAWSWWSWLQALGGRWDESETFRFAHSGFYVLSGLHALHVVGGIIPMAFVTRAALHGAYTAPSHAPVQYLAMYWHFLDVVWLVLFASLLIGL